MMDDLLRDIATCQHCTDLPLGPRPVVQASAAAKVLIIGQAPGTKVHKSGVPWDDASGERLRSWLGLTPSVFYDPQQIAIMPMGFCYPGKQSKGGDLPPRPECAPLWHKKIRENLPALQLTLLVGSYAQKYYLKDTGYNTMGETVAHWADYHAANIIPLPHPSWRVVNFIRKNPWFEDQLLPVVKGRIADLL